MSEPHLPHDHSGGAMLRLQESVETAGSFQTVADIFKLLSDSSRVRIFWLLCHCEECVVDLSATVGMSPPAVSHHLRQLRESGLLISRRVGKEVYYRAAETEQAQLVRGAPVEHRLQLRERLFPIALLLADGNRNQAVERDAVKGAQLREAFKAQTLPAALRLAVILRVDVQQLRDLLLRAAALLAVSAHVFSE